MSINSGNYGSTGKIMSSISDLALTHGYMTYQAFPENANNLPVEKRDIIISSDLIKKINQKLSVYTGFNGCFSIISTYRLIRKIKKINPTIIHFHNLHNSYINLRMIFKYIKKNNIAVVWTLHDCWAFTGHCAHFTIAKCDKWKRGCEHCSQYRDYPYSKVDHSRIMYYLKKKWFTGMHNTVIVTPSVWLAELVNKSFLQEYPVCVINNGIDLNIFRPTESNFHNRYNIKNKFVILGVSFDWTYKKGLDVFVELSQKLDNNFQIVLVGTDDKIDSLLSENIISIHRTENVNELAGIYSAADLFVNPTREESFSLVNAEALACGTPVVTFNSGGAPEIIDESCGYVIEDNSVEQLIKAIMNIRDKSPFTKTACIERAKKYNQKDTFNKYIELYAKILRKVEL